LQIVVPGDHILHLPETGVIRVGTGLHDDGTSLTATKTGVLLEAKGGKIWVASRQKRYIPSPDEPVLGTVQSKFSEYYEVDIGGPFTALLPVLAFDGATRRNRPNLKEGDLVYCRVDTAHRDMQPTLACTDGAGRAAGFGPLKGGYQFACSTAQTRALLGNPPPPVLLALGRSLQFELAVGLNGRVWVDAASPQIAVLVSLAVQASEGAGDAEEVENIVAAMLAASRYDRG